MNPNYQRVIPRDLFNEAKLLKCIGHLALKIHERMTPTQMGLIETGNPFKIALLDEGALTIVNLDILLNNKKYIFKTTYNSKANFPLFVEHNYTDYLVFSENGEFDIEFIAFVKTLEEQEEIQFTRIDNDTNGNPRYVCHFLSLIKSDEKIPLSDKYATALIRAKKLGGKKYHTKKYGGGIVFQSYNIEDTERKIQEMLNELK